VLFPARDRFASGRFSWILVPVGCRSGKSDDQNVRQAVAVDVLDVREKVVGIAVRVERFGGINLVASIKIRSRIPMGTRNDIDVAVVVDIACRGSFAEKYITQLLCFPRNLSSLLFCPAGRQVAHRDQDRDPPGKTCRCGDVAFERTEANVLKSHFRESHGGRTFE